MNLLNRFAENRYVRPLPEEATPFQSPKPHGHTDKDVVVEYRSTVGAALVTHAAAPEREKSALVSDESNFLAGPRGF